MRILLIVPLPPPITGHSLVSQQLADSLSAVHDVEVINLSVGSLNDGRVTVERVREVGKVLRAVWRKRRWADACYLTISESRAGNLKDLFIYLLSAGRLRRFFIHLHGGTIGRELFDRHRILRRINAAFIGRLGGIMISGPSHLEIFAGLIERRRVHIVPNSADDQLFVTEPHILDKFAHASPIRVLYISAMTPEKGYLDLLDGWLALPAEVRANVQLDFAGRFDTDRERSAFGSRLEGRHGVRYHGVVDPECKRRLFAEAHAFCLPTRMLEGQPISILEAYASGCAVITTGQPGIRDVFADGVNGFEVLERSPASMATALSRAAGDVGRLRQIALANRQIAGGRYRRSTFTNAVKAILETARQA